MLEALLLAVVFIYLILASQFGTFLQPLAIMLSLPLSLVGVVLALTVTHDTLNIMSMIGLIMLMGLVTKNAILLVDFANQRRAGMAPREALLEAGRAAAAADRDDDAGHDLRHAAPGPRARRRRRVPRPHGPRRDRRADHLDAADADGGAGRLHVPRRLRHVTRSARTSPAGPASHGAGPRGPAARGLTRGHARARIARRCGGPGARGAAGGVRPFAARVHRSSVTPPGAHGPRAPCYSGITSGDAGSSPSITSGYSAGSSRMFSTNSGTSRRVGRALADPRPRAGSRIRSSAARA